MQGLPLFREGSHDETNVQDHAGNDLSKIPAGGAQESYPFAIQISNP